MPEQSPAKRRNPADLTGRNNNARKKEILALSVVVRRLLDVSTSGERLSVAEGHKLFALLPARR